MDIELCENEISKIANNIVFSDVLYYINENSDKYLLWLRNQLKNDLITLEEYKRELIQFGKEESNDII